MPKKTADEGAQFLRYFGPLLDALRALGGSGSPSEVTERIAADLQIPDAVQNELLPSGELRFRNQVAWARQYLVNEGLLDSSQRGTWTLTEKGWQAKLNIAEAREIRRKWVSEYTKRRKIAGQSAPAQQDVGEVEKSPEVEANTSKTEVLRIMQTLPPSGFERLCQLILRESGFQEVEVTGRSGDNGIDGEGLLRINPLVSLKVLFQCKRYKDSVSSGQVRDFRGAMSGRTEKGIILTTGTFTADAKREASRDGVPPIELIDGDRLVTMLQELELGLKPVKSYRIDEAFFEVFKADR